MSLQYPYPPPLPGQSHHLMQTRIPPTERQFLRRLLPFVDGLNHIILAILVKKLIDELRRIDSISRLEPTLYVGDPTQQLIERLLDGITFGPFGRESGPDEQHGTGGVCEEMRGPSEQRAEQESGVTQRKRRPRRKGGDKTKGRAEKE